MPNIDFVLSRESNSSKPKPKRRTFSGNFSFSDRSQKKSNKKKKKKGNFAQGKSNKQSYHTNNQTKNSRSRKKQLASDVPQYLSLDGHPTPYEWNPNAWLPYHTGKPEDLYEGLTELEVHLVEELDPELTGQWLEDCVFDFLAIEEGEEEYWTEELMEFIKILTKLPNVSTLSRILFLSPEQRATLERGYCLFIEALGALPRNLDSLRDLPFGSFLRELDLDVNQYGTLIDEVLTQAVIEDALENQAVLLPYYRLGYLTTAFQHLALTLREMVNSHADIYEDDLRYDHEWAQKLADEIGLTEEQAMRFPYFLEDSNSMDHLSQRLRLTWDQERRCRELLR